MDVLDEWVRDVPARWRIGRARECFSERVMRTRTGDEELLSVSQYFGVKPTAELKKSASEMLTRAQSLVGYKIALKGDLVVNTMLAWNGSMGIAPVMGIVSPAYAVYRPSADVNSRFFHLLLTTPLLKSVIRASSSGIQDSRLRLYPNRFFKLFLAVPTLDEQELIVRYLDHAELRIAKAIAAKSRLAHLLEEKRRVVSEEIILGRRLLGATLAESGVPWIGKIPNHWQLVPNRAHLKLVRRLVGKSHGKFPLLSLTLNGVIVRDLTAMKGKFPASFESYQEVRPGEFVFCLFDVDETPRTVGLSRDIGMITGAYDVFRCDDESIAEYLYEFFLVLDRGKKLKPLYRGLRKTVPRSSFQSLRVPMPPRQEREVLLAELDGATRSLDRALDSIRAELDLLKEYRTRLISDVVTGKLDVRAEAAKLPVIDPDELAEVTAGAGPAAEDDGDDE